MSETVKPFTEEALERVRSECLDPIHREDPFAQDILSLFARLAAAEELADHGTCPDGATEYACRKRTKWLKTRGIKI